MFVVASDTEIMNCW